VHSLLEDRIKYHNYSEFEVKKDEICNNRNGSRVAFTGLREHNVDSIKSYQGFDYCHVEEAHSITERSLGILIPTIRKDGSEFMFSYNRDMALDPVHKLFNRECAEGYNMTAVSPIDGKILRWVEYRGNDAIGLHINYDGNPFFPEVLRREMEKDKADNEMIYQHKWLGMPQPAGGDIVVPLHMVMEAVNRAVFQHRFYSIGVDPARFGDDESVVCWRDGFRVMPVIHFRGVDTMRLAGEIITLARAIYSGGYTEAIPVKIDDTGVGGGVTDRLNELQGMEQTKDVTNRTFNIEIIPIVNNGTPTEMKYINYGAEMWYTMRTSLSTVSLPNDPELITQLTTRRYKLNSDGRIELEKKDAMKKRGLNSPDRADALALCMAMGKVPIITDSLVWGKK